MNLEIIETKSAKDNTKKLPEKTRQLYDLQKQRLSENSRDPRLHLKKMVDLKGVYSFRITRSYRALFYFTDKNTVVIFSVGNRKDIYKNL